MPQVIAEPLAMAAFNAGAGIGVANAILGVGTAGVILHNVVGAALVIGASYAIAKLTAPPTPKPSDGTVELQQPMPARFWTYGLCKISGPVLLLEKPDETTLEKIVAFGTRHLGHFEALYVNQTKSDVADLTSNPALSGSSTTFWSNGSNVWLFLGHSGAEKAPNILWSGWTSAHRLRSIPYLAGHFPTPGGGSAGENAQEYQEGYPDGIPEFAVVGGVRIYDPRLDSTFPGGSGPHRKDEPLTWTFSDNQRLCTLDWLTYRDGYAKSFDRIDWATWIPQINMADELVPLKAGGTERRYRVATRVGLDEPRSRVLHRLMQAGDQQLFITTDGKIGSRGGVWQTPTVELEVERMHEAFFTHGVPMMDRCNEFQLSCMLPDKDYVEFDLPPWSHTDDPEWQAGIYRRQPLDLTQVPSATQAMRLAKIYMMKKNPRWNGHVRTGFRGLDAIGQETVRLEFGELDQPAGSFNGPFFINRKISFLPDRTGITFPVASADPTAYDWTTDDEIGIVIDESARLAIEEGDLLLLESGDALLIDPSGDLESES